MEQEIREAGIPVDLSEAKESKEDIEDDIELNYKVPVEAAIELCTRDVFRASGQEEIQRKVANDIFENNIGATKICYENGRRTFRYVDIANLINSYASYDDYRDIYYVGEVRQMSIADAIQKYPDVLEKEDWVKVAHNFSGRFGNADFGFNEYYAGSITWEALTSFKVLVFDFQWKTNNTYRWKKKTTKNGSTIFEEVDESFTTKYAKTPTEVIDKDVVDIYEGVWIVDDEKPSHLLKWEKKGNMIRRMVDGELIGDTEFDYTIYKPNMRNEVNVSLCELIKPHAKNIIIYNINILQMVGQARPAGAAIDVSALLPLAQGLGDPSLTSTDADEIYAAYNQSGIVKYSSVREDGSHITNTNPVIPLEGGVPSSVQNLLVLRTAELQEIYNISGFNPAVDGSAPQKDALVGIEKMRTNSFNLTMKPYADSMTYIIQKTAEKIAEQEKDRIVSDKSYAKRIAQRIGKDKVDAIKLVGDASLAELSIYMEYEPEDEDIAQFNLDLERDIQAGNIDSSDAINCREIAKTSLKRAIIYLKKAVRKKRKEDAEIAQANSMANIEAQQASNQQAEVLKQQTLQLEWQLKTQYMVTEKQLEGALKKDEEIDKRITKILEGEIDEHLVEISMNPDPNVDTIATKISGGETPIQGKIRKAGVKGNTAARKTGTGQTIPKEAGGSPRVGVKPADNAIVNARQR